MSRVRDLASILTASSSMATDTEVSAVSAQIPTNVAGKNAVINGAFDIWQRGTSAAFGGAGVVTSADRWATYSNGNATLSRQATGDSTNLPFIQYCARMQRNSGGTATLLSMGNSFETINSIPFAGKTVTMSFYARKGANYSPTADAFAVYLRTGTGTDQNVIASGYTGSSGLSTTVTLTSTWQRFTLTGVIGSNVTEIAPEFRCNTTGTAGANDYAEITGVQVEVGSVATPFSRAGGNIHGELAACYRYFQKFGGTQINESFPYVGFSYSTTQGEGPLTHKNTMRTTPSLSFSTLKISDVATYNLAVTNLALTSSGSGPDASYLVFTVSSGTSSGKINYMRTDASTAGYLYLNAEL